MPVRVARLHGLSSATVEAIGKTIKIMNIFDRFHLWHSPAATHDANRTDEGVKALKAFLKSPDRNVSDSAEMAIRQAYASGNPYSGHPLKPDDFPRKYQHVP